MNDDEKPVLSERAPGGRDIRTRGEPRASFAPHSMIDEGIIHPVYPANQMKLGYVESESGERLPAIHMFHLDGPAVLLFVPNVEELRAISQSSAELADEMEAAAGTMLNDTLAKRGKA